MAITNYFINPNFNAVESELFFSLGTKVGLWHFVSPSLRISWQVSLFYSSGHVSPCYHIDIAVFYPDRKLTNLNPRILTTVDHGIKVFLKRYSHIPLLIVTKSSFQFFGRLSSQVNGKLLSDIFPRKISRYRRSEPSLKCMPHTSVWTNYTNTHRDMPKDRLRLHSN